MRKLLSICLIVSTAFSAQLGTLTPLDDVTSPSDGVDYSAFGVESVQLGNMRGTSDVVIPSEAAGYGMTEYQVIQIGGANGFSYVLSYTGEPLPPGGTSILLPLYVANEPTATYPSTFMPFDVSGITTNEDPVASSPEIGEWNRTINEGESGIFSGYKLSLYENTVNTDVTTAEYATFGKHSYPPCDTLFYDIPCKTNTIVEIKARSFPMEPNDSQYIFGSSSKNGIAISSWSDVVHAYSGDSYVTVQARDTNVHTYVWDNENFRAKVDDGAWVSMSGTKGSGGLINIGSNESSVKGFEGEIYYIKIWEGDTLVANLAPVPGDSLGGWFVNSVDDEIWYNTGASENTYPLPTHNVREIICSGEEGQDSAFFTYAQTDSTNALSLSNIRRIEDDIAAVEIADDLPSDTMYMLWPANAAGVGKALRVNQTEAWWIGFDRVSSGDTFRVYGRNLDLGDSLGQIYIDGYGWLEPTESNPYMMAFTCPVDLANGTYDVYVHNGHGGAYGWSDVEALSLTVQTAYSWSGTTFDVTTYGADGSDANDDLAGIEAAYAASSDGDTIYFPAGTYYVSDDINPYDNRKWVGAGIDTTYLKAASTQTATDGHLFNGSPINVEFSDMTWQANPSATGARFGVMNWGDNVVFNTVKFDAGDLSTMGWAEMLTVNGNDYMTFKDCETVQVGDAGNIAISSSYQVIFDGCDFVLCEDNTQVVGNWGGDNVAFMNNTATPRDITSDSGRCDGRWFVISSPWGATENIYIAGNTSTDMAPVYDVGYHLNTGEQILLEGGGTSDMGDVISATSNTVTITTVTNSVAGDFVMVNSGKGMGQVRQIASISGGTATLERNWNVIPDTTSFITVGGSTRRVVVYDNHFDGNSDATVLDSEHSASTAVEFYGQCTEFVVDNNLCTDLRTGFYNYPIDGTINGSTYRVVDGSFFNEIKNNTVSNCYYGLSQTIGTEEATGLNEGGIFANVYRGNTFTDITDAVFANSAVTIPQIQWVLMEGNVVSDAGSIVRPSVGQRNSIYLSNNFTGNGTESNYSGFVYDELPLFDGNTLNNVNDMFFGNPQIGVLNADPLSIGLQEGETTGAFTVLNSGFASIDWAASTDDTWLNLTDTSGTVADQNGSDALGFTVSTNGLSSGDTATIELVSGTQTQVLSVVYYEE